MPTPGEHKTVQARILEYAEAVGWTPVSREEAERRRGFDPDDPPAERATGRSLFLDDLLEAKVRKFNPRYSDGPGALLAQKLRDGCPYRSASACCCVVVNGASAMLVGTSWRPAAALRRPDEKNL